MNISIIIPVFNAAQYVEQATLSALNQNEVAEVILIEDGSNDNSLAICQKLVSTYINVKLYHHPGNANRGAGASRNLGINRSRHPFIAFLDADDFYLDNRFKKDTELFQADDSIDGVYGCTGIYYESDTIRKEWLRKRGFEITSMRQAVPHQHLFRSLLFHLDGSFTTDAITIKKSLFEKTDLFNVNLRLHQDTAMWLKMAALGKLVAGEISVPTAIRRVHPGNRITQIKENDFSSRQLFYHEINCWGKNNLSKIKQQLVGYRIWKNKFFQYDLWTKHKRKSKERNFSNDISFFASSIKQNPDILFSRYLFWFFKELFIDKFYKYYRFNKPYK